VPDVIWRRADGQPPTPADWHDPGFRCLGVELRMAAEGADPGAAAIYAVFNTGAECVLRLPDTAPAWELILDTTRPDLDHAPGGPGTRAPAQSVLVFRSVSAKATVSSGGKP
jgi:glycogen operon protein